MVTMRSNSTVGRRDARDTAQPSSWPTAPAQLAGGILTRRGFLRAAGLALGGLAVAGVTPLGGHTVRAAGPAQRIGVPAYFVPTSGDAYGSTWERLLGPKPARPVTGVNPNTLGMVIINPQDNVPAAEKQAYIDLVKRMQWSGITVLGYAHTEYGKRDPIHKVRPEIDDYFAAYKVNGIFLDQASKLPADLPYYRDLHRYIKGQGAAKKVVLNPGGHPDEAYMAVADVIVTFEDTYTAYTTAFHERAWVRNYPAERFWHLIHTTGTTAQMQRAVSLSKQRNAGWVYVTPDWERIVLPDFLGLDDIEGDPWDSLPSPTYWSDERRAVEGIVAPQGPICLPGMGC